MQELAPIATLVVATVALYVGLRTLRQRDRADRREQWWQRFAWAADLVLSDDKHRRDLGLRSLDLLAASRLGRDEELELLDAAVSVELERRPEMLDDGWNGYDDGQRPPEGGSA